MPFSRNTPTTLKQSNRIGPGERSGLTLYRKIIKSLANDEIRAGRSVAKVHVLLKMHAARNEAWTQQMKRRASWRASQGLGPLPPAAKGRATLPDENINMEAWLEDVKSYAK